MMLACRVRPDGHLAWRSDLLGAGPLAASDGVRGVAAWGDWPPKVDIVDYH